MWLLTFQRAADKQARTASLQRLFRTLIASVLVAVGCKKQKQTKMNLDVTKAQYKSEWLESWDTNIVIYKSLKK